jgi:hypothetical protein
MTFLRGTIYNGLLVVSLILVIAMSVSVGW